MAYLIDASDIVRDEEGNIDAEAALNASHGDVASYFDEEGIFFGGTFGSFIMARIMPELAPSMVAWPALQDDIVAAGAESTYLHIHLAADESFRANCILEHP